jgi:translocation and assembly module TamB
MMSWNRRRKVLLFVLPGLLLVGVVALGVARHLLSSGFAAREVAEQLQSLLGGRVEVGAAHIGLEGESSVQDITAYDTTDNPRPWLRIRGVQADLSVARILTHTQPTNIQLDGAEVVLHFDSDGHLVTRLPSSKGGARPLPHLHIKEGELTLAQAGRDPMVLHGVTAEVTAGADGEMKIEGRVHDPYWSDWSVDGRYAPEQNTASLVLDTKSCDITMAKLRSVPFIPASVWEQVQVEGETPARVALDFKLGEEKPSVHYRVELSPHHTHVRVASINLEADRANGKVVVDDNVVKLDNVVGEVANGAITTDANMNFRDAPTRMTFKLGVRDAVLHDLPKTWRVPEGIDGRLTGSADVVVTVNHGKVQTTGTGEGVINQPKIGFIRPTRPIHLYLHADGQRLHFRRTPPPTAAPVALVKNEPAVEERVEEGGPALGGGEDRGAADVPLSPGGLAKLVGRGVNGFTQALSRGIGQASRVLTRGEREAPRPAKPAAPTYLDVDFSLKDVDIAQLIKSLKLQLPYAITGRLTTQAHVSVPINTPGDTKAYRFQGTVKLSHLEVAGVEVSEAQARARYADGVLDLHEFRGQLLPPGKPDEKRPPGTFDGTARVQVVPQGDLEAELKLEHLPLDFALEALPKATAQAEGALSGDVKARVPLARLTEPAAWRGSANLTSRSIRLYGLTLRDAAVGLTVEEGRARLGRLTANLEGAPVKGSGEVQLTGAYPVTADLRLQKADLAVLQRLSPSLRPPVTVAGTASLEANVTGTLSPMELNIAGKAEADNLVAEGVKVNHVAFNWTKGPDRLALREIQASLYGGEVTGSVVVPLNATLPGTADVKIQRVNARALAEALASPVRVEGRVSGSVTGKLAAGKTGQQRSWTTDLNVQAPELRIQGIPAQALQGTVDSHDGKTTYSLEGKSLGGTFKLNGELPPREQPREDSPPGQAGGRGSLELRNAQLSALWAAYNITGLLSRLEATVSLRLDYRHTGPRHRPEGTGRLNVSNVTWDQQLLSDNLRGEITLAPNFLDLHDIYGSLGQGQFNGRFVFGLVRTYRSWFRLNVQQVDASVLLTPLPSAAGNLKGPVDMDLHGRIDSEWSGSGNIVLMHGQVFGMDVTEWRLPVNFTFDPTEGNGGVTVRDSTAVIARGRGAGHAIALYWGNGLRLDGTFRFYDVDLRTLFRHHPSVAAYASGRMSGRIDFSGQQMRSLNDLTARVQADFQQAQALQFPLLREIAPYLRAGVSQSTFQSGDLRGLLRGGIFRVQRLTLNGNVLGLIIQGNVTVGGRLDLDVTAASGTLNPSRLSILGLQVPDIGAIPRLVMAELASLLANRVLHLRVTGTLNSPVIRVQPLPLTEEVARFFLGRLAD